ncbi:prepilin-type N-terminal cleavage/methylation domain-containing protein [Rhodocyclus tenuis]|uniref:prepilin-type N-terminal cleavage/methylation domain-containing protein n=1 Tax=Rhodocyclus gracilis TaxID=2929842 RepID=UPI001298D0FA|nr:prepilin-type N-terminal cleavage/methylation domain-containing protein [Rhodocyclus gracilis]MRD73328.1 prepilin-type N-terminal cleavage/methylation domain-containing protein [Rhodocyclus gracilis]
MKTPQSGFTLVEIAIVLVIIGLLLGGVLKGQELINSAKVKNMASDFQNLPVMIYGYQDKFRKLPGDDDAAAARFTPALDISHQGNGNGVIQGLWNADDPAATGNESVLVWEHLRRANLGAGATDFGSQAAAKKSLPTNTEGGRFGVSGLRPISSMSSGSFYACSDSLDGKYAVLLDTQIDDGKPDSGAVQAIAQSGGATQADGSKAASRSYSEGTRFTVCMSY